MCGRIPASLAAACGPVRAPLGNCRTKPGTRKTAWSQGLRAASRDRCLHPGTSPAAAAARLTPAPPAAWSRARTIGRWRCSSRRRWTGSGPRAPSRCAPGRRHSRPGAATSSISASASPTSPPRPTSSRPRRRAYPRRWWRGCGRSRSTHHHSQPRPPERITSRAAGPSGALVLGPRAASGRSRRVRFAHRRSGAGSMLAMARGLTRPSSRRAGAAARRGRFWC